MCNRQSLTPKQSINCDHLLQKYPNNKLISVYFRSKDTKMIHCCSLFEGFIITLMVGAGSLITIVLKWADQLPSLNSIGENAPFSHPFLQSTFMFLGELFCIALFYVQRCWRKKHRNVELNKGKDMNV